MKADELLTDSTHFIATFTIYKSFNQIDFPCHFSNSVSKKSKQKRNSFSNTFIFFFGKFPPPTKI